MQARRMVERDSLRPISATRPRSRETRRLHRHAGAWHEGGVAQPAARRTSTQIGIQCHPSKSITSHPSAPTHICICPHLPQTPCHSSDSSRPSRLSDTRPGPFRQPGSQRRADRRNQGANIAAIGNRVPRNAIDRLLLRFITVSTVLERAGCALQSLLQQRSEHTGTSKPSGNQPNKASLP